MAKKVLKIEKDQARRRVEKIMPILSKTYPHAAVTLNFGNPLELLIATILAAQCTDKRVNIVTEELFKKYSNCAAWANADIKQLEDDIRPTGFYRNKAKNIKETCRLLLERFAGKVPDTMDELLSLAGVGRKTANVLLGNAFGKQGIVCDTHVIRLSHRLGLSANSDPVKLEFDLMEIVPKRRWGGWTMFSHLLVFHGRNICKAPRPDCPHCPVDRYCPSAGRADLW